MTVDNDAAHLCLLDSLACAFHSLQQPACTRMLGPVVPGATMTFGARVPGTSLQLDPVQAAFNLGTLVGWGEQQDPAFATSAGHLADPLGAVLTMADFQARRALAEGRAPATVREVLAALIDARAAAHTAATVLDRVDAARSVTATAVASMLGATEVQLARAAELAACEARDPTAAREPWWLGDANARGVRIALLALAEKPSADPVPDSSSQRPQTVEGSAAGTATRVRDRLTAAVAAHFPPVQAGKLRAMLLDPTRLEALPINELVSLTVRN